MYLKSLSSSSFFSLLFFLVGFCRIFFIQKKKKKNQKTIFFQTHTGGGMGKGRYLSVQPQPPAHVVLAAIREMG